jgi:hypothetical protein
MKRRRFNIAAALSALVFIATIVLWIRSYWRADYLAYCGETKEVGIISTVGRMVFYREKAIPPFRWQPPYGFEHSANLAPQNVDAYLPFISPSHQHWGGFGAIEGDTAKYRARANYLPYWSIVLIAAVRPAMWLRQARRSETLHCGKCGYDLRATPQRCPECGTPAAATQ